MPRKFKVSIIIVNYSAHHELFNCLKSLSGLPSLEIIVIDNDETPVIKPKLDQNFPQVRYFMSAGNIGFGAGCNLGATKARGHYLFFLNPDTRVLAGTIQALTSYLDSQQQVAVVGPLLLNASQKPYPWVGTAKLTPLQGLFALSFINHLWPNNPVSAAYWVHTAKLSTPIQVGVIPGTALMIRQNIFHQVGGFDPRFFLYFEESDLCYRVTKLNQQIVLVPKAKVVHYWGKSGSDPAKLNKIFQASRYYYFRKHFGLVPSMLVELFCRFSPKAWIGIK